MKKRMPPVISQILVKNKTYPAPEGFPSMLSVRTQIKFFEENPEFDLYASLWEKLVGIERAKQVEILDKMLGKIGFRDNETQWYMNSTSGKTIDFKLPPLYETLVHIIEFQKEFGSVASALFEICVRYNSYDGYRGIAYMEKIANTYAELGLNYVNNTLEQTMPIIKKHREIYEEEEIRSEVALSYEDYRDGLYFSFARDFDNFVSSNNIDEEIFYSDDVWKKFDALLQQPDLFLEAY